MDACVVSNDHISKACTKLSARRCRIRHEYRGLGSIVEIAGDLHERQYIVTFDKDGSSHKYNGVVAAKLSFAAGAADVAAAEMLCQQVGCSRPSVVQRATTYAAAPLFGARFFSLACAHLRSPSKDPPVGWLEFHCLAESLNPAEPRRRRLRLLPDSRRAPRN